MRGFISLLLVLFSLQFSIAVQAQMPTSGAGDDSPGTRGTVGKTLGLVCHDANGKDLIWYTEQVQSKEFADCTLQKLIELKSQAAFLEMISESFPPVSDHTKKMQKKIQSFENLLN